MALHVQQTDGGVFRAYDEETGAEGYGTTRQEARENAKTGDTGVPVAQGEPVKLKANWKQAEAKATRAVKRKRSPEPPAENQLSSLEKPYLPVADKLLEKDGLTVPEWGRAMLAKLITTMRELPADNEPEPRSPIPALTKAQTHLLKLLEYAEQPPAHKERIKTRCASLREALLSSALAATVLACETPREGVEVNPNHTDYGRLLDALDSDQPLDAHRLSDAERRDMEAQREKILADSQRLIDEVDAGRAATSWKAEYDRLNDEYSKLCERLEDDWEGASELRVWLARIERVLARDEDSNEQWLGSWPSPSRRVVEDGWLAWNAAGRRWSEYYMSPITGKLTGPLPDFLRDLIACCNGTHDWVAKPPRRVPQYFQWTEPAKMGDALRMADAALFKAIQRQEAFYREVLRRRGQAGS
jgi:hypothetical protein